MGKMKDKFMMVDSPASNEYFRGREEAALDILRSARGGSPGVYIDINVAAAIARGDDPVTLMRLENM
jgi:hypothetical protein